MNLCIISCCIILDLCIKVFFEGKIWGYKLLKYFMIMVNMIVKYVLFIMLNFMKNDVYNYFFYFDVLNIY